MPLALAPRTNLKNSYIATALPHTAGQVHPEMVVVASEKSSQVYGFRKFSFFYLA